MQDSEIIALYWQRDEAAIAETSRKYGAYCFRIAGNILTAKEDAEECVNDAYHRAWNAIPPERPEHLGAWLGRVVPQRGAWPLAACACPEAQQRHDYAFKRA